MYRKKIPFLLASIFLICNFLRAQTFNFKTYTDEDGLAQSYVYCVSQSSKGFLYLSTGDGFCKFDGNEFKTYTKKDNLAENFINTHFTDSRNITWIGHFQNGVSYLSGNTFYKVKGSEKIETKVNAFAEDKLKNIWVAAQQKGLYKIDSTLKFKQIVSTATENFNAIHFDLDNQLLAATDEGLFLFKTDGQKEITPICSINGFEGKKVACLIPCDSLRNAFWVAVPGEGVFKILKAGSCYYIYTQIIEDLGSASMNVSTLFVDNSRNLWVALLGEGLRKISFDRLNISNVLYINKANGLSNEYIQSIFQDFEDNMWFGTSGGGLIEMPINKFSYFVPQTNVKSILTDSKTGNIWTGNDKGLLLVNLKSQAKNTQFNASNGFVNDQVNALMQDSAGNIWIGTSENGVFVFNAPTNKFENFSKKNNLKSLTINSIAKTSSGNIAIGTTDGLYFFNLKKNSVTLMTTIEGLLHNNIQQIYLDSKNRLWLSSPRTVPYYIKNEEFTVFKNVPDFIDCVAEDNTGLIWIATETNGVVCYDGSDFRPYKTDDGLLSNFCYFVMVDANNTVWVGHKNGLSKKEDGQKLFKKVTKADGLLFQENNLNACFKDEKKNMWFGTSTGVVNYDCENNKINTHEPRTTILGVNLDDHFYTTVENISVPYKHYSARIDFIGVSLVDPTKVNYKYRMLGLDTIWRYTSNRYVEFPKIAEGTYTFQLLACNNDGIWNIAPAEIKFEIDLPIWKKAWFYILATLFLVALLYFIIVWRTRSLIKARVLLEKMVDEKTFLLKKEKEVVEHIKSELEEKNKDITDSINYAKRIQEAILPSKESILKIFPEAFILYKPKDIVSGDFYWFTETEDYYLVAAIDCTGHGVPGAFMSLIASTLLKEIVSGKKVYVPSKILQELNNSIIDVLKQSDSESSTRDGMDMSICCIDKKKSKLTFAGAARPLYFIRDKVLVDTKGQGYPIGGHYGLMNLMYSDTEMDLQKNDLFYIFSDGFADQFRDGDKKKFTTKRLKALLTEICDDDMETQSKKLDSAFEQWKGSGSQIDDILIIGIRI